MQKLKRMRLFKTPNPNKSVDRSWSDRSPSQRGQHFDFSIFVYFLVFWSSLCLSQLKSPIFLCPMPREFWFLVEIWPLSKYMSIWCIWHEIHAIRRYIHQEFVKQSLDHKEITPSCLIISTNCSSLRGFVKYQQVDFLCLQIQVLCHPFVHDLYENDYMLNPRVLHKIFLYTYSTSIIIFNRNMLKR